MEKINVNVTLANITQDNKHRVHSYVQRIHRYPVFNELNKRIGKVKLVYLEKDRIKAILEIEVHANDKVGITDEVSRAMQSMALTFKL